MLELIVYFISLLVFFWITFKILKASNLEKAFKKNKTFEIWSAYIIISLATSDIISSVVLKFFEWAQLVI